VVNVNAPMPAGPTHVDVPDFHGATRIVVESSPSVGPDGIIYVGSDDDNLYAIKPDGTLKWKFPTGGLIDSSPMKPVCCERAGPDCGRSALNTNRWDEG
jgi:hypothetical protein